MESLSEHMCQGWLEGYLLTGRHGFFSCYEAFIHIVDSMFNQHAKWLKTRARSSGGADRLAELPADLARLAAGSQRIQPPGPGLHRPRVNKKADVVRVYLPPDANTLLSVADHCLRSRTT
jgi:xylulose-5-phosphate/fructose-6-phosphate phosphoketolase